MIPHLQGRGHQARPPYRVSIPRYKPQNNSGKSSLLQAIAVACGFRRAMREDLHRTQDTIAGEAAIDLWPRSHRRAREGTHPQGMGHLHREAGGPEAAPQEPFIPAGGLAHRLCGPCTGHVLQQAADARAAVGEAVHAGPFAMATSSMAFDTSIPATTNWTTTAQRARPGTGTRRWPCWRPTWTVRTHPQKKRPPTHSLAAFKRSRGQAAA